MPNVNVRGGKFQHIDNSLDSVSSNNSISNNSEPKVNGQKKKRPRQRLRVRNKNYKLLVGNGPTEQVNGIKAEQPATSQEPPPPPQPVVKEVAQPAQKPLAPANERLPTPAKTPNQVAASGKGVVEPKSMEKTREQVLAEREAKKLAKQTKKQKSGPDAPANAASVPVNPAASAPANATSPVPSKPNATQPIRVAVQPPAATVNQQQAAPEATEKTREQIKAEREAKKNAKQAAKTGAAAVPAASEQTGGKPPVPTQGEEEKKKPTLTKAERRAIQEAQRAAKAQALAQKAAPVAAAAPKTPAAKSSVASAVKKSAGDSLAVRSTVSPTKPSTSPSKSVKWSDCCVLFKHLESPHRDASKFVNDPSIHPSITRLGVQYANRTVVGSNARCIAFLHALKMVIQDFETPPKKEFGRSLETRITHSVEHLEKCRALAVSVSNAYKHIKHVLTQLPVDKTESELKENLCHFIDTYIENQIGKAAQAISSSLQEKIKDGDVILTFGCSSLIDYICEEAHRRRVDFRVIVVDSRPFCEGQEQLRRLTAKQIPCTYVLINAVAFVMPQATKVLLGAHALLSNGYVMSRTGTAQVALVAHSFNVPVLVCCETHKFSERYQTDAIVFNELGNPDDLIRNEKCCLSNWQAKCKMTPLNLMYDITPPELVTAVVTEVSILPCTSVPVILRIKPTEIGYYS